MFCIKAFPRKELASLLGKKLKNEINVSEDDFLLEKVSNLGLLLVNKDYPEAIICKDNDLIITIPFVTSDVLIRIIAQLQLKHYLLNDEIRVLANEEIDVFCSAYRKELLYA